MRGSRLALCAAFMAVGGAAPAQDAARIGLAREMISAMKVADNFDAVVPSVLQALKPALAGASPKAAKDFDEAAPLIAQEMSAAKGSLIEEIATIYAKSFETAELQAFVAFYRTGAGEKLARLTPTLAQQTLIAGTRFGQEIAGRLTDRMRSELRRRGNAI